MGNRYVTPAEKAGAQRRQDDFAERMKERGMQRINIWLPSPLIEPLRRFGEAARLGGVDLEAAKSLLDSLATTADLEALKQEWAERAAARIHQAKGNGRLGAPSLPPEKIARIQQLRAEGVSPREVAGEVGVAVATVYKYSKTSNQP